MCAGGTFSSDTLPIRVLQDSTVRKTIARLLLLRSPGEIFDMKADQFEVISEPCSDNGAEMLDGCGFIPDNMLLEIVEKMGKASGGLTALREIIKEEGLRGKVRDEEASAT